MKLKDIKKLMSVKKELARLPKETKIKIQDKLAAKILTTICYKHKECYMVSGLGECKECAIYRYIPFMRPMLVKEE